MGFFLTQIFGGTQISPFLPKLSVYTAFTQIVWYTDTDPNPFKISGIMASRNERK